MVDDSLSEKELSSVKKLAFSVDRFEPFAVAVIPRRTLRHLVEVGVAEKGQSCRPAVGSVGYRLTEAGWRVARAHWKDPVRAIAGCAGRGPAE